MMENPHNLDAATPEKELPESGEAEQPRWSIRRILVALDASTNSREALATAVNLASTLKSEIHGIFVEDVNLLRLAELPFAREIQFANHTLRQLEINSLQRQLRARAAILRRELEEVAGEHQIASNFTVSRGQVERELMAAAGDSDVLVVGRLGHSLLNRMRLGSTARAVMARAASAVLLVKADVSAGPIIALYDGSVTGLRALRLAAELAEQGGDLRVLVWGLDEEEAFARRQLAVREVDEFTIEPQFQHLSGDLPLRVLQWVNRQKGNLLLLGGGEHNLPQDILDVLLAEAEQHVLVIK
jgi:nucleotide-binding universal stress UspA family protein